MKHVAIGVLLPAFLTAACDSASTPDPAADRQAIAAATAQFAIWTEAPSRHGVRPAPDPRPWFAVGPASPSNSRSATTRAEDIFRSSRFERPDHPTSHPETRAARGCRCVGCKRFPRPSPSSMVLPVSARLVSTVCPRSTALSAC